jgi:hypothetical protein
MEFKFEKAEWLETHENADGTINYRNLANALEAYYNLDGTAAAFGPPSENADYVSEVLRIAGNINYALEHQYDDPQPARAKTWLERHPRVSAVLAMLVGMLATFAPLALFV